MNPSSQRIIDYIESQGVVTASEIARALGMTSANARYHLRALSQIKLVERVGESQSGDRGRPHGLFQLGGTFSGENIHHLCDQLLRMYTAQTPAGIESSLDEMARGMVGNFSSDRPGSIPAKLTHAVVWLNERGYRARWEAHRKGPQVFLGNCPYAALVEDHPELCKLDGYILEALLNNRVTQEEKLQKNTRGAVNCVFSLSSM